LLGINPKRCQSFTTVLNKIKTFETPLMALSHDELRGRTAFNRIKQARADKDAKIAALKLEVESIEDIDKEKISTLLLTHRKRSLRYF
jgi:preprotein translocase subunit SecA